MKATSLFPPAPLSGLVSALALTASLVIVLGGCASVPAPSEQMAVAEAAVKNANTSSTSDSAPGELQVAIAKLAAARQAMSSEDYVRAGQLAEQAQVDAQVAELHAQTARSRKAAMDSKDAARVLREEINRKSP
jgi:phage-related minor tail protein